MSDAVTLVTSVTWPSVNEEQRSTGVLMLKTGVACLCDLQGVRATPGAGFGTGSMLPVSMLLMLPVLRFGCVKGAGGVGTF